MEYLFTIFHRLNTGGTKLNNQEIRNCIFSGAFNTLLKELNENTHWRSINRLKDKDDSRFKNVEMILRHFAFNDNLSSYKGILSKFLNEYMRVNRDPSESFLNSKKVNFTRTVELIATKILNEDERVGVSILEALLAGISQNIDRLENLSEEDLKSRFRKLREHSSLATEYLNDGVAKKEKVQARISASIQIFS